MEMPIDVIGKHLNEEQEHPLTNTQLAMNIDLELQRKFYFIPREEVDAVAVENTRNNEDDPTWVAGSGPETIRANAGDNPTWLYNSAVNALAMMQWLQGRQAEEERRAKRPEPGVYHAYSGGNWFSVIVTDDRRIMVPHIDGGMNDYTEDYDEVKWKMQRIDTVTGTLAPQ